MTRKRLFPLLFILITINVQAQYKYPLIATVDSSDTWHNVNVKDPYRLLENLKNPDIVAWYKAQATYTDSIINTLPLAHVLFDELKRLDEVETQKTFGVKRIGNSVFYNQVKLNERKIKVYRKFDNSDTAQIIASPEMWGENFNIRNYEFDPTEQYLAITAREGGNFNGGHSGDATDKFSAMKEQAKKLSFVLWQCGFDKANKYY